MSSNPLDELKALLSEPPESIAARERGAPAAAMSPHKNAVLFGAGSLGRKVLRELRSASVEVCCLSDNNPSLWGTIVDGIELLAPAAAAERFGKQAAFVVTIWNYGHYFDETKRHLQSLGCQHVAPVYPMLCINSGSLFPHYSLDWPHKVLSEAQEVLEAYSLWSDEPSRECYLAYIRSRLRMDFDRLPPTCDHYPQDIVQPTPADVFVDCGEYTGDTIEDFLRRRGSCFGRVVAIEPDPANFAKLTGFATSLSSDVASRIELVNSAVGDYRGTAAFISTGNMASGLASQTTLALAATTEVNCALLDDVVACSGPKYIKVDVEGGELSVLRGATRLLTEGASTWAVTTEHRQSDLWNIPLFIRSASSRYKLYLRSHFFEGWELVCYAVPDRSRGSE